MSDESQQPSYNEAARQCAGGSMPQDVSKRIEAQDDLAVLSDWCAEAIRCNTWEKARQLLGLPAGS
jgi:hypothetical protein